MDSNRNFNILLFLRSTNKYLVPSTGHIECYIMTLSLVFVPNANVVP